MFFRPYRKMIPSLLYALPSISVMATHVVIGSGGPYYGWPDFGGMFLWLTAAFSVFSLVGLWKRKWLLAASLILPLCHILLALHLGPYRSVFSFLAHKIELIKLSSIQSELERCKRAAVPVSTRGALAVCESYPGDPITYSIIYDSTGEIGSEGVPHSSEWIGAALSLNSQVPFGILGFVANKIEDQFYRVEFDIYQEPEDYWRE